MRTAVKRVYEKASKDDGTRVLVDRLWPRGISKAHAHISLWMKDASPSNDLRKWFHEDPEKHWGVFQTKYRAELRSHAAALKAEFKKIHKPVTLVTGVKDIERSHIPVLRKFLTII